MVDKGEKMLKISVKGSQDGSWGLCQSHLKNANYHGAIDKWSSRHKPGTVLCFVRWLDECELNDLGEPAHEACLAERRKEEIKKRKAALESK